MAERLNVYIWDMDETLILLKSLINGTYAQAFNGSKDVQKGLENGRAWENHILQVCDDYFFYEQIESCNKPFLDAVRQHDDGRDLSDYDFNKDGFSPADDDISKRKLAYRHRVIADIYKKGLHDFFDKERTKFWDDLYDATDSYTDNWLSSENLSRCTYIINCGHKDPDLVDFVLDALVKNKRSFSINPPAPLLFQVLPPLVFLSRACVEQCSGGKKELAPVIDSAEVTAHSRTRFKHVNVLVTSGSLIPSLVKCLLFRLDDLLPHENVYSSWDVGKPQCFSWIKERFGGQNVRFCVIGDGWEECEAAQTMGWPFVQIDPQPGSIHRFPGLNLRTLGHYFSVVYGNDEEEDEQFSIPTEWQH